MLARYISIQKGLKTGLEFLSYFAQFFKLLSVWCTKEHTSKTPHDKTRIVRVVSQQSSLWMLHFISYFFSLVFPFSLLSHHFQTKNYLAINARGIETQTRRIKADHRQNQHLDKYQIFYTVYTSNFKECLSLFGETSFHLKQFSIVLSWIGSFPFVFICLFVIVNWGPRLPVLLCSFSLSWKHSYGRK